MAYRAGRFSIVSTVDKEAGTPSPVCRAVAETPTVRAEPMYGRQTTRGFAQLGLTQAIV